MKGTADLLEVPGGAGMAVAVTVNADNYVTFVTEVANSSRAHTVLVGGRVREEGFSRGGATGLPGRFYLEALVGWNRGGATPVGVATQFGAGGDLVVVPRGLALHLAVQYLLTHTRFLQGKLYDPSGPRVSVGFVVGPHLKK